MLDIQCGMLKCDSAKVRQWFTLLKQFYNNIKIVIIAKNDPYTYILYIYTVRIILDNIYHDQHCDIIKSMFQKHNLYIFEESNHMSWKINSRCMTFVFFPSTTIN